MLNIFCVEKHKEKQMKDKDSTEVSVCPLVIRCLVSRLAWDLA